MTNLNRSLQIFFWAFAFIYVVLCSLQITQIDLWWQLSEGAHILHTWSLPTAPAAAFGLPAQPYFDEYAGYEVVLALLFKISGFSGLWMAFASVYLLILFLPVATSAQKYPAFDFSSTFAMLFAGILMKERLEQRPELVAGLFLVLLMVILRKSALERISPRLLTGLFFLFIAWSNTHSSFIIGYFVIGLWVVCELLLKYSKFPVAPMIRHGLAMIGLVLVAAMLNPYGPRRLLFPFLQASDPGSTALSPEMWPITDPTTVAGVLVTITVALLVWGLVTTRGVPLWLTLFSLLAVILSLRSFRFINILAIALLFVYAVRAETGATGKLSKSVILLLSKDVALCLLCVFFVFGNAYSFLFAYDEMKSEPKLAVHTRRFAPEISAIHVEGSNARVPVLCGHGIGSYLSLEGNSQFRPLLDSGLSHFSGDTKRYFFFLWHSPEALALVLHDLHVNYVLLERDTFSWIPTLHRLNDWEVITCDSNGMLWKRRAEGTMSLTESQKAQVESAVQELQRNGKTEYAFDYSTLLDNPARSLGILELYGGPEWSEAFFNSYCAWVDSLPPQIAADYLKSDHSHAYPLIDAVLWARVGPEAYEKFIARNPPGPRPWFWRALQVQNFLGRGDKARAKSAFDTITPAPISSVTYYRLWHEVNDDASRLNAYGQWQTWNDDSQRLIESMSGQLNDRMQALDPSAAR